MAPVVPEAMIWVFYNTLNPENYVQDVLKKIADGQTINKIGALLPWHLTFYN
jgi:hypothetical protein